MRNFKRIVIASITTPTLVTLAQDPGWQDLGTLPGGANSYAYSVSADGSVIVGYATDASNRDRAIKYSNGLMEDLGTLPQGAYSQAYGVSADGTVIVGYSTNGIGQDRAFKYSNGQMQDLGTLGGSDSLANSVSADGTVIVGYAYKGDGTYHAFKYSNESMQDLDTLGGAYSEAYGVSADGSVIVGWSMNAFNQERAFKYSNNGPMQDLGTLGGSNSQAYGVSADGSVIVGYATNEINQDRAFKYSNGSMQDLGTLGGSYSYAYGVNADGSVIVGYADKGDGTHHAFKYSNGQMQDLGTLGGSNSEAYGISADGSIIVGHSQILSNSAWHAFLYGSTMVDLDNTLRSILYSGHQLNGLLNLKNFMLANQLNRDCTNLGDNGFGLCISAGYPHTNRPATHQISTALTAGYRWSPRLRLGATVDFGFATTTSANIRAPQGEPLIGVFAVLNANENHQGAQLKIAAATSRNKVQITRSTLPNTEAGQGWSRLTSQAVLAEIAYNLPPVKNVFLQPYLGMRLTESERSAYQETSGATFPISYGTVKQEATTLLVGAKAHILLNNISLNTNLGLEHDIRQRFDNYTGTIAALSSTALNLQSPHVRKTRLSAGAGACYDIAKAQQIGVNVQFSHLPNNRSNGLMGWVCYNIGF